MRTSFLLTERALKLGRLLIQSALFVSLFLGYRDLLKIKMIKKLMNLDRLACFRRRAYFFSINSLSAGVRPTFNLICTVCNSSSRIL